MRNWKTTTFGCLAMALTALHVAGITLGHVGNTDYITFGAIASGAAFAYYCKDKDNHSTISEVQNASNVAQGGKKANP